MDFETLIFFSSFGLYVLAFLSFTVGAVLGFDRVYRAGRYLCLCGAVLATTGLIIRWVAAGHPPLSNMYESMYTFTTMFVWVLLGFTRRESFPLVEGGAAALAVLMTGVASVFGKEVRPLVPALQSYWLHLHVSIAFVGEACFAFAFILSYLYCVRVVLTPAGKSEAEPSPWEGPAARVMVYGLPTGFLALIGYVLSRLSEPGADQRKFTMLLYGVFLPGLVATLIGFALLLGKKTAELVLTRWLPSSDRLDELSYKAISLGYPLFTVGAIIFGMVWANKAWGRYWGWDPKETWALITFLVYSGYLHVRLTKGWRGTPTAVLSMVGFIVTLFTLFGVNLILSGLHSYASG